jgi:hypothetical protein
MAAQAERDARLLSRQTAAPASDAPPAAEAGEAGEAAPAPADTVEES